MSSAAPPEAADPLFSADRFRLLKVSPLAAAASAAFGILLLTWGLRVASLTIGEVIETHTASLQGDEWTVLSRYITMRYGGLSPLGFLWEQHNEHRVVLARLLFMGDILLDRGTQVFTKTVTLVFCSATAALFSFLLFGLNRIHWGTRLGVAGLFIGLFMSPHQMENLYRGFNNQVLTVTFFAVLALYLLWRAIETNREWSFWAAIISAALSSFSMANGLAVWPIMLVLCLVLFAGSRRTIIVAALAGLTIGAYLVGYVRPPHHPNPLDATEHVLSLLGFLATLLAGPFNGFALSQATAIGAFALVLTGYYAVRQIDEPRREGWFLLSVCLLVIAFGVMVTIGRAGFGIEQALASRYSSYMAPLYAALLLLGLLRIGGHSQVSIRRIDIGALSLTALIFATGLVPGQSRIILEWAHGQFALYEKLSAAAITGAHDETVSKLVADPREIMRAIPYVASHGLSMFRDPMNGGIRVAVEQHQTIVSVMWPPLGGWCKGFIDEVAPLADPMWRRISGWAVERATGGPGAYIVFADETGRVIGAARYVSARPDVDAALGTERRGQLIHFVGYARAANEFHGYLLRADSNGCGFQ